MYAKLENLNPGGSVKDRICLGMINDAERKGIIKPGRSVIVEPTSGNTGIGLALVCLVKGYRLILTMPDDMSKERRMLLSAYGAELVLTPAEEKMDGAVRKAEEIQRENPGAFMPRQFQNPANPETHLQTTGPEILEQVSGEIHGFVAGVGTGGSITGIGRALRERFPNVIIVAVEPAESAVLSGEEARAHRIQGIGVGFVPEILDTSIYDRVEKVSREEAIQFTRLLARKEGLLVGISAGANGLVAARLARELGPGKQVVTLFPDAGDRYLSTEIFE